LGHYELSLARRGNLRFRIHNKDCFVDEYPLTPTLSRKRKEIIHPHLNPLPSRERKIKEKVFHRAREIMAEKLQRLLARTE
jgi:hypothetical protein